MTKDAVELGDDDELDLFQQPEATTSTSTSHTSRPKRAVREATKYPRELSEKMKKWTTPVSEEGLRTTRGSKGKERATEARTTRGSKQGRSKRKANDAHVEDLDQDDGEVIEVSSPAKSSQSRATGKAKPANDIGDLDFLLTSPKSPLVGMEISDILNAQNWFSLSETVRERLAGMLPETAFVSPQVKVDDYHPSQRNMTSCQGESSRTLTNPMEGVVEEARQRGELDISFFTDPHFESAARTFQDHLYTGWYTRAHRELIRKYQENIQSGNWHAPWKDDVWSQNYEETPEDEDESTPADPSASPKGRKRVRPNAFGPLIKSKLLAVGDIVSLNKAYAVHDVIVEKDALVYSINPKTNSLTVVTCFGTRRFLPGELLVPAPDISICTADTREITVDSPMQLERALLDADGRVPRPDHSHNASKCISMWRWPPTAAETFTEPEMMQFIMDGHLDRGGRELYGTLFYLKGTTNCG